MRRRIALALLALCGALAALLAAPPTASAHPLGNFTVNRYAGIEVAGSDVYVRYALDLAEIPTYQLGSQIRRPGYPAVLAQDLVLTLDGRRCRSASSSTERVTRPGAGGLKTLGSTSSIAREGRRHGARVPRRILPWADRLARGDGQRAGRRAGRRCGRPGDERE